MDISDIHVLSRKKVIESWELWRVKIAAVTDYKKIMNFAGIRRYWFFAGTAQMMFLISSHDFPWQPVPHWWPGDRHQEERAEQSMITY